MRSSIPVLAGAILLSLATASEAAVLATPPAWRGYPTDQLLTCSVLNLHSTPRDVRIEILDYDGVLVTATLATLANHQSASAPDYTGPGAWCRFILPGSAKKYRAHATYSIPGRYQVLIPAQ